MRLGQLVVNMKKIGCFSIHSLISLQNLLTVICQRLSLLPSFIKTSINKYYETYDCELLRVKNNQNNSGP